MLKADGLLADGEFPRRVGQLEPGQPTDGSANILIASEVQLVLVHQSTRQNFLAVFVDDAGLAGVQIQTQHAQLGPGIPLTMPHKLVGTSILENHAELREHATTFPRRQPQDHTACRKVVDVQAEENFDEVADYLANACRELGDIATP